MTDAAAGRRPAPGAAGAAIVVVASVLATWVGARGGSFQFDDWNVIVDEPRVASIAAWWASMPGIRPLLKLTYAAGRQAGLGYDGFLAVNVGIHAVAALLVLALLRRVAAGARVPAPLDGAAPLLGALLFALHPVQTEAVTY
ncbi:MAG TPA: hypothetical protein VFM45_06295, partial [Anaeromyxobacteraceae bacterium]|nr:hypothetical protein [Anaeromyxobacteraceae bacterium]